MKKYQSSIIVEIIISALMLILSFYPDLAFIPFLSVPMMLVFYGGYALISVILYVLQKEGKWMNVLVDSTISLSLFGIVAIITSNVLPFQIMMANKLVAIVIFGIIEGIKKIINA